MSKTLLLADDSITIQKVVGITFANEDYKIVSVDNGEDAVNKAGAIKPDIILADVVMPKLDGYQVCEKVKADPNLRHIPVLLLTGAFKPFDENRSKQAGADGHIAKPFDSQTLIDKVKELVSKPPKVTPVASAPAVNPAPVPASPPVPIYTPPTPPPAPSGKLEINPSFENAFAPQASQEESFQDFAPSMDAFSTDQDPFTTPTEKPSQDSVASPVSPPAPVTAQEETWDQFGETTASFDETPMASEPPPSEMPSPMELSMFEGLAGQPASASEPTAQEIPENIWNVPVAGKPVTAPPPISAPSFPAQVPTPLAPAPSFIPPAVPPSFPSTPFTQTPQAPAPFIPPAAPAPANPAFTFTPPAVASVPAKPPVFTPPPTPEPLAKPTPPAYSPPTFPATPASEPPSFSFDSFEEASPIPHPVEPPAENPQWQPAGSTAAELPPMPAQELQTESPVAFHTPALKEVPASDNGTDTALKGMTREVIEKIAWEIIPDLAESIIREEIERLKREKGVFK